MALNIPLQGKEYFCFRAQKTCLDIATGTLCVTLTSQVVVYAQAERAVTFSLSRLSPSLLCDFNHQMLFEYGGLC
jgi:hypothetical protein